MEDEGIRDIRSYARYPASYRGIALPAETRLKLALVLSSRERHNEFLRG